MIKKVITGNQAVESDTFQLVVTVTGTAGEKYKVTLDNAEQNPLTSGEKATYTVTNNTEIHIYGLTEGDKDSSSRGSEYSGISSYLYNWFIRRNINNFQ